MSSSPASIKRIWSKATEKRWWHHFPHYKSMGAFCCHGHQSFDSICLKTLRSLSPLPVMLHIKFDQDWPTCLRDIQVRKCKIFVIQGQVTPLWVVWSGPKSNSSELLCLSWLVVRSGGNSNLSEILCMSSLPASIKKIRSKTTKKRWRHRFSHCNSMGAFCCLGNQSFDLICAKTLCSLSPTPVMLHIKLDLGWLAGFRDIQVWKCGRWRRRTTTTERRRTIAIL